MSPLFATDIALAIVRHGCVCEHVVLLVSLPTVETYRVFVVEIVEMYTGGVDPFLLVIMRGVF